MIYDLGEDRVQTSGEDYYIGGRRLNDLEPLGLDFTRVRSNLVVEPNQEPPCRIPNN